MLREYQTEAVQSALRSDNGIIVLPTGSGKSHVIAALVNATHGNSIILQPTKEILESNFEKIQALGISDVSIYSASMNSKRLSKATYATIGSIIKIKDQLKGTELLIIDEAHLTNAKGGQYLDLIESIKPEKIIGLTATPYRLYSNSFGSTVRILTRTRPKIWKDIVHVTQSSDLIKQGFLIQPKFEVSGIDTGKLLGSNTTGADYSDYSIGRYSRQTNLPSRIVDAVRQAVNQGLAHILIFISTLQENDSVVYSLKNLGVTADSVSGMSTKSERENKLKSFRNGEIRAMVNVGILTTGYDFPRLDCIIGARPTMSLALYYQMIGRCVRPHPDKHQAVVFDLVNNFGKFGNPFSMMVVRGKTGLYSVLSPTGRLTGRTIDAVPEMMDVIEFGKYKGSYLKDVPINYMEWWLENVKKDSVWHMFDSEIIRRKLFSSEVKN